MRVLTLIKKHENLFFLGLLLLLNLITYHSWFFSSAILSYGDWDFAFPETLREIWDDPLSLWISSTGFGSISFSPLFGPIFFLVSQLASWGVSTPMNYRFIYFWPIVLFSATGYFFFGKKIIGSPLGGFFTSLIFNLSVVTISIRTGHLTIALAQALAPFAFLSLVKTLEKNSLRYAILTAFLGYVVSINEVRFFYLAAIIMLLYSLYFVLLTERQDKRILRNLTLVFIPFLIIGLLNSTWLLPYRLLTPYQNTSFEFLSRGLFGVGFYDVLKSMTGWNIWWTGATQSSSVQPVPLHFWSLPILAILGFITNWRNKNVVFFLLIFLIGVFLAKQSGPPFPNLYSWLYYHFPGFNAFRESSKFLFLAILGQAILIAAFADWLWRSWVQDGKQTLAKYIILVFIAFLFLVNSLPLITGEIKTVFVPRQIPKDYLLTKDFILGQDEFFRTLWIPRAPRWAIFTENHPKLSGVDLTYVEWNKYIKDRREIPEYTQAEILIDLFKKTDASNLLNLSSIKYVFVPQQDVENEDDFFIFYGKSRRFYIEELDKIPYLKKLDLNTKYIEIYENLGFRPHIYLTRDKDSLSKNFSFETINYYFVSPTLYTINLENLSSSFYLNFSDTFHPDWKLKIGPVNWVQTLLNRDISLPNQNHLENEAGFNSFLIDPEYIINNFPQNLYTKNQDGSINVPLTLYFRPQAYLYLGLVISVVTLATCLIFLIIPAKWFSRKV